LAKYLFKKRGIYYFERRVPRDLSAHYQAPKIIKSLKTKRKADAVTLSAQFAQRLDAYWASIRLEAFSSMYCKPALHEARPQPIYRVISPLMSEALDLYISLKGRDRDKRFNAYARRAVGYLFEAVCDKPISEYTRSDANLLRDMLITRGLVASSIKRNFEVVRAVFNLAEREGDLGISNPFSKVLLLNARAGASRPSLSNLELKRIQEMCISIDDDMRWVIGLISDTGMRLAEACGAHIDDFRVDDDIPHIIIRPHPWRQLKTSASERNIPLVGAALWSAKRVLETSKSEFAFPRYCNAEVHKADSASNALNKWMRPFVRDGAVIHSFRHSIRDRLREIECPSDIIDQIGGWQSYGVGQCYGQGYSLNVMHRWMSQIGLSISNA